MCGIACLLGPGAEDDLGAQESGLDALRHRGPDGRGSWFAPGVALGHVRLATVGLRNGAQPIVSPDGRVAVAVTGEIYGDRDLRRKLEARGRRFQTESDSEVLLHLFEEQGPAAFGQLDGEFACLVWDGRARRLYAARDRFGTKPLLLGRTRRGQLAVASEPKGLFAMGVPKAVNEGAVASVLTHQYCLPGETLFEGVTELVPGEVVTLGEDGERVDTGALHRPAEGPALESMDAAGPAILGSLRTAVTERLRAEVPVCALLSGGVDSTAVAALAARAAPEPMTAFTVAFGGSDPLFDEARHAFRSAAALGLRHRIVEAPPDELLMELPAAVRHAEVPAINLHMPAKSRLFRAMRREGFVACLSGEGADEVFLGYPHLRRDAGFAAEGRGHPASAGLMLPSSNTVGGQGVERATWVRSKLQLGSRVLPLLTAAGRNLVRAHAPVERLDRALAASLERRGATNLSAPRRAATTWSDFALAGYIFRGLGDGMELRHGIEGRVPFVDPRVVETAARVPVELHIDGPDGGKHALRGALAGVIPEDVRTREKHPFISPAPGGEAINAFLRDHVPEGQLIDADACIAAGARLGTLAPRPRLEHLAPLLLALSIGWLMEDIH